MNSTPSAEDISICALKLNMLVKQLQGTADQSRGLKVWSRKRGYVLLEQYKSIYHLGPASGDRVLRNYIKTNLKSPASFPQTTIRVREFEGIKSGDNVRLYYDSGASITTTAASDADTDGNILLNTAAQSLASVGNIVISYSNARMNRPIKLLTACLTDINGADYPLDISMTLEEYQSITLKNELGIPSRIYYEAQLDSGAMYLDCVPNATFTNSGTPDTLVQYIKLVYLAAIDDFNAVTDTPEYPQEWFLALTYQLAVHLAPTFGRPISDDLKELAKQSLAIAQGVNMRSDNSYFQPGLS